MNLNGEVDNLRDAEVELWGMMDELAVLPCRSYHYCWVLNKDLDSATLWRAYDNLCTWYYKTRSLQNLGSIKYAVYHC